MNPITHSHGKQPPPTLDPAVEQLVQYIRQLKEQSGLALKVLAAETSCSKSSWQRWLNGKGLPSWEAVAAMIGAVRPSQAWACVETHDRTRRCTQAGGDTEIPAPKPSRR